MLSKLNSIDQDCINIYSVIVALTVQQIQLQFTHHSPKAYIQNAPANIWGYETLNMPIPSIASIKQVNVLVLGGTGKQRSIVRVDTTEQSKVVMSQMMAMSGE